jgi:hypothetical protein
MILAIMAERVGPGIALNQLGEEIGLDPKCAAWRPVEADGARIKWLEG